MTGDPPVRIHGWAIYAHPLFLEQLNGLERQVTDLKARKPHEYHKKNPTKRLAAITKLAFDIIPQDPTRPEYRLGGTLGAHRKHWFRAKFFQKYRLFFRFSSKDKVIVFAWGNDQRPKRAYGAQRACCSGHT
ncbi:MAG: type II toxin-antitoxin system YhaV family toxin [Trueperaceae bacterium]|nr:type II toxin-antitoxin system YhaV family toxin [Trueperaceae bacterium]